MAGWCTSWTLPPPADNFEQPEVHDYLLGGGNFAPTAVEYLEGLYYVTTGLLQS